jgi:hypothetical protein
MNCFNKGKKERRTIAGYMTECFSEYPKHFVTARQAEVTNLQLA